MLIKNKATTPANKLYSRIALLILSKTCCLVNIADTTTLCCECPFKTELGTCFVVLLCLLNSSKSISIEQYTIEINDIKTKTINWLVSVYGERNAKELIVEVLI